MAKHFFYLDGHDHAEVFGKLLEVCIFFKRSYASWVRNKTYGIKIIGENMIKRFIHNHDRPVKPMNKTQRIYRDKVFKKFKNNEYTLEKVSTVFAEMQSLICFQKGDAMAYTCDRLFVLTVVLLFKNPKQLLGHTLFFLRHSICN